MPPVPEQVSKTIETLYRSESGRILATLVRLLGDLNLAEEAVYEAFAAALECLSGPVGHGEKRFFAEGTPPRAFDLVGTKALASGVILSTYQLNGPLRRATIGG